MKSEEIPTLKRSWFSFSSFQILIIHKLHVWTKRLWKPSLWNPYIFSVLVCLQKRNLFSSDHCSEARCVGDMISMTAVSLRHLLAKWRTFILGTSSRYSQDSSQACAGQIEERRYFQSISFFSWHWWSDTGKIQTVTCCREVFWMFL